MTSAIHRVRGHNVGFQSEFARRKAFDYDRKDHRAVITGGYSCIVRDVCEREAVRYAPNVEGFRHVDARRKFPKFGMDCCIAFSTVVYIYCDDACLVLEFYRLETGSFRTWLRDM